MIMVMKMTKKTDKYLGLLVKIYPFQTLLLGKKKDKKNGPGINLSPPPNGQCPFKIIYL